MFAEIIIPLSVFGNVTNVTCYGNNDGSISIQIIGGVAPYNIIWSNGSTRIENSALEGGNYTVNIIDNSGNSITETFTVLQPNPITTDHSIVNEACLGCQNGSINIEVTGGIAPYSINWSTNESDVTNINDLESGTYTVAIQDMLGCMYFESYEVLLNTATVLDDAEVKPSKTTIYYRSETNQIYLDIIDKSMKNRIEIIDIYGQLIFLKDLTTDEVIDISSIKSGIFIVKLISESEIITRKFVK